MTARFTRTKYTLDGIVGVTQVLSRNDTAQINVYYAQQSGYLTDPYKALFGVDQRPDSRDQIAVSDSLESLLRWPEGRVADVLSLLPRRLGSHAPTRSRLEWAQEIPHGFTLTPGLRYTTQSAAYFYYDPVYDAAARSTVSAWILR